MSATQLAALAALAWWGSGCLSAAWDVYRMPADRRREWPVALFFGLSFGAGVLWVARELDRHPARQRDWVLVGSVLIGPALVAAALLLAALGA